MPKILLYILDTSKIPLYILDALNHLKSRADKRYTIEEMELSEEIFQDGVNFVVDEIETDGAELLGTKYCGSEIAFAVTGRDIKCAGHKFRDQVRILRCDQSTRL
jgi:hypothetical protein